MRKKSETQLELIPETILKPEHIRYEFAQPNMLADVYTGTAEETYFKSPMVPDSYQEPYNPDDLWQKKGDYSLYEDMLKDDQVSVCLKLKKDLVLGSGFQFIPGEEGQEEIVESLEQAFCEDIEIPFSESLEEILSGYEFGFSLSEKVFKVVDGGKLGIKFVKTRHPNSFLIYQDPKGNIEKYEQSASEKTFAVEPNSLIHFINNRKFQNPYGISDLRAAYNAWFSKRQVIRYYAIFLEKASSPIPVARYDKNAPQTAVTAIHDAIKRFQTKTALTIPKDIEVEFLETSNTGDAFQKAINIFNMFIARSLFIPDLLGISGSETSGGSYSLGKEQMALFFMHINRRRNQLEALVNHHLVKPLVQYNFGLVESPPKFKFIPLEDGSAIELAKVWLEAVKAKTFEANDDEINHFRKLVKFPEGDILRPEPPTPPPVGINPMDNSMPMDDEEMGKEQEQTSEGEGDSPTEGDEETGGEEKKVFRATNKFEKKVDFKAIKTKLDDYDTSIMKEAQPVIKKIVFDLIDQIEKKKIVQLGKVDRIDSLKVKYLKELNQLLKASLMQIYKDGQVSGSSEILKGKFAKPIVGQKFIDIVNQEISAFVGDWADGLEKNARVEIMAAVKDQLGMGDLMDILQKYGETVAATSVERFARTKHTEVFNKGRLEFFQGSGVVDAYEYSAILDDVTTDLCASLDGLVFKDGTQPVPPLHFNALVSGSLIKTARGDVKIEEVKIGDLVVTHLNNYKSVYDVMNKYEDKEYYEIELDNGNIINITGEHPVLCSRGWVRVDELKLSDNIVCFEDIKDIKHG